MNVRETDRGVADQSAFARQYRAFLAQIVGIVALLGILGAWPTHRLGGSTALVAMVIGCGISVIGSLLGSVPIWMSQTRVDPAASVQSAVPSTMAAFGIRMLVAVGLGLLVILATGASPAPLLLWIAISHGALLFADVRLALRALSAASPSRAPG